MQPVKSACSEREGVGLRLVRGGYVACRLPKRAKGSLFSPAQLPYYSINIRRIAARASLRARQLGEEARRSFFPSK